MARCELHISVQFRQTTVLHHPRPVRSSLKTHLVSFISIQADGEEADPALILLSCSEDLEVLMKKQCDGGGKGENASVSSKLHKLTSTSHSSLDHIGLVHFPSAGLAFVL